MTSRGHWLLVATGGVLLVAVVSVRGFGGASAPESRSPPEQREARRTAVPPPAPDTPPRAAGSGAPAAVGAARPPDVVLHGRRVWFAPPPDAGPLLKQIPGPLPAAIRLDQAYPPLQPGSLRRAVMAAAVVGDTAAIERLLVLDDGWQLFEVDLTQAGLAVAGRPALAEAVLAPDGTRIAVARPGGYRVADLTDLSHHDRTSRGPAGLSLSWRNGRVVTGPGVQRVPPALTGGRSARLVNIGVRLDKRRDDEQVAGIAVSGPDGAMLLLDGERVTGCCAVVGWLDPHRVLYESRWADRLDILAWNFVTGEIARVSTIRPVVANDWYLVTSYAAALRRTSGVVPWDGS